MNSRLTNARLDGSNLREALLVGALLESTSARGTDFRDANLTRAVLNGAVLAGSDLRGADLRHARLRSPDRTAKHEGIEITIHGIPAELRDANLVDVKNAHSDEFNKAYWDEETVWPDWHTAPCARNVPEALCITDQ